MKRQNKETDLFLESLSKEIGACLYLKFGSNAPLNFEKKLKPDSIIVPVGRGTLLKKVVKELKKNDLAKVPIITAESEEACPFATALFEEDFEKSKKELVRGVFSSIRDHRIYPQIVEKRAILEAISRFHKEYDIRLDEKSAAAIALLYQQLPLLKTFTCVLVVI